MIKYALIALLFVVVLTVLLVLPLRWLNPPTTAFILRDNQVATIWQHSHWSALEEIAPIMQMSVIAAEDQRFPNHYGFDFKELSKAVDGSWLRPRRGASTLTQQLVKNVYLWPSKSIVRKLIEAYFTVFFELFLPKERILELYLNVVEFGPGIYGVSLASEHFFQKTPSQLSRTEASMMATVLPNPKAMSISAPSPYMYERALDIRLSIRSLGGSPYLQKIYSQ